MKALKTIGNCCLVFLTVIAVCVIIAYVYYHFFVHDKTVGVNYVDNQIGLDIQKSDELTEEEKKEFEERYFIEANFYSNAKNNGIALQEMKLNYFTDYKLLSTSYRSTGMQYLGDLKQEDLQLVATTEEQATRDEPKNFTYYDTTNGINWDGGKLRTQLNRETAFIISIDNKPYQIQLDKTYEWTTYERQWYTLWIWNKPTTHVWLYNYLDVFADCMQAIRSNSAGYGDYYITVDLSEYFTIRAFDTESGKFKAWITRIAHNLIIDNFRQERSENWVSNDEVEKDLFNNVRFCEDTIEDRLVRHQVFLDLKRLVKYLPDNQREVLEMRYYRDMSFKEIADATGVSINTALGRMRYAILNMRRLASENRIELSLA